MNQDEINQSEWQDPDNWSDEKIGIFYFSKRDMRVWVPKRNPIAGWTLNIGQPQGAYWMLGFLIGLPIFIAVIFTIVLVISRIPTR